MSYEKHNFKSGDKLFAAQLNEMDEQIAVNESNIPTKTSDLENDSEFITSEELEQKKIKFNSNTGVISF